MPTAGTFTIPALAAAATTDGSEILARSGRFVVEEKLGSGGFGTVFRAHDRLWNMPVALKVLHRVSPEALFRFKQEFRRFAELRHPNLVRLHELFSDGDHSYFSMELCAGRPLLDQIAPVTHSQEIVAIPVVTTQSIDMTEAQTLDGPAQPPTRHLDEPALRHALAALCDGLGALHGAGLIHCDLKPSNILMEPGGRVVILDFGLAAVIGQQDRLHGGTPGYMAPEQWSGAPLSPATDCFALGAILHQALTGAVPAPGDALHEALNTSAPADLVILCRQLLQREPPQRPTLAEIRRGLGHTTAIPLPAPAAHTAVPLVGRAAERALLQQALTERDAGHAVVALIEGDSGVGKSALMRAFLDTLTARRPDALVLASRCYDRESVPYKALDGIIDALSSVLGRLPEADTCPLGPHEQAVLCRLFPVLKRVAVFAQAPQAAQELADIDGRELRRRGIAALRDLLAALAQRRTLILAIDDLHWGDADGLMLLGELLRGPAPPQLLLVATCWPDQHAHNPHLLAWRERLTEPASACQLLVLKLTALAQTEMHALAAALLGDDPAPAHAARVAAECGGNPLFAELLAARLRRDASAEAETISLDSLLGEEITGLDATARRLLGLLAVAGAPLDATLACDAAGVDHLRGAAIETLREHHLLVLRPAAGAAVNHLECFHDRVRHAALDHLDPAERGRLHLHLAEHMEQQTGADPAALYQHFHAGGERDKAGRYAIQGAAQAMTALAFDRAVDLYGAALALAPPEAGLAGIERWSLVADQGRAYAGAGKSTEAAHAFEEAARRLAAQPMAHAQPMAATLFDLRRQAFDHALRSGHIDQGLILATDVLRDAGIALPGSPLRTLGALLWERSRLWVRNYRAAQATSGDEGSGNRASPLPARADACWSVAVPLSMIDPLVSHLYYSRHLRLALALGEPTRLVRALTTEATYLATLGDARRHRKAEALVERSLALAASTGDPYTLAVSQSAAGIIAYMSAQWKRSLPHCQAWDTLLRDHCTNVFWERATAHGFLSLAYARLGQLAVLEREASEWLRDATARHDIYEMSALSQSGLPLVWLAQDEPDRFAEWAIQLDAWWPQQRFLLPHFLRLIARVEAALYQAQGERAFQLVQAAWPALQRAFFLRLRNNRIELRYLRARAALLRAAQTNDRREQHTLHRLTLAEARRIASDGQIWCAPIAALLRGTVALQQDQTEQGQQLLAQAAAGFAAIDMPLHAEAARFTLDRGAASAALAVLGVAMPERFVRVYAPGVDGF